MVDDDGVLWVPDLATGQIVTVDGRTVAGTARSQPATRCGLGGRRLVVAINPTAPPSPSGGRRQQRQAGARRRGPGLGPVVGDVGYPACDTNLVNARPADGRSIRIELTTPDDRLGTPAIAGRSLSVRLHAGTLLMVDLATKQVVDTLRVTGRARTFELVVEDGRLFVKTFEQRAASTVNAADALMPVAKYDPTVPATAAARRRATCTAASDRTSATTTDRQFAERLVDHRHHDDRARPPRSPSRDRAHAAAGPTTTSTLAPVVIVPPSTTKAPEPSPVTIPATEGGNGDEGKGRGDRLGAAARTPATAGGAPLLGPRSPRRARCPPRFRTAPPRLVAVLATVRCRSAGAPET